MYQSKKRPSFDQKEVKMQKVTEVSDQKEADAFVPFVRPTPPPTEGAPIPMTPPPPPPMQTPPPPHPNPPIQTQRPLPPPIFFPPHQRRQRGQMGAHFSTASTAVLASTAVSASTAPASPPHFRRRGQDFSAVTTSVFPATEGDADDSRAEFERENPKIGILRVETFLGGRALPVDGVNIVITHRIGDDDVVYYNVNTNEVGIVDGLTLPAPDASTSQSPNEQNPFAVYQLYATRDSYLPIGPIEIQIFDGIKTIQPILMQWRLGGA